MMVQCLSRYERIRCIDYATCAVVFLVVFSTVVYVVVVIVVVCYCCYLLLLLLSNVSYLIFFKLQKLLPGICPYVHDANAVVVEAVVDVG